MSDGTSSATFDAEHGRLLALAYRMLGTPDDAEDVVQEAWLRWDRTDETQISNPAAWLTTVTTRIAIDRLTSAQVRREVYTGPWLPEPRDADGGDPSGLIVSHESVTLGFLRILETLHPVERAVLLLHDVFGYPFSEVAATVDRTVPATRQIAHRARERVRSGRPRLDPEPDDVRALADAFLGAVLDGDMERLTSMLTDDVVLVSDGGPEHHAARRPVHGPVNVGRLVVNIARREVEPTDEVHWVRANGQLGLFVVRGAEPFLLTVFSWRGERVAEALSIVNPDKLRAFHASWLSGGRVTR